MAQVKDFEYDLTQVESGGGGGQTGVQAPAPAVYDGVIRYAKDNRPDGKNWFRIGVDVGEEYDWVFENIHLSEAALWKLKELAVAIGLPLKGKLKESMLMEKRVRVKLAVGTQEYGPEIKRFMKPLDADATPDDDGPTPDDTPEPAASTGEYPNGYVPWREGPGGSPEDPEADTGSYEDWPDADLKAEFDDRGLEIEGRRTKGKLIEALRADDVAAAGEGGSAAAAGGDEYDQWSDEDLATEIEKRELTVPGGRGDKRQKMLDALRADDEQVAF